MSLRPSKMSDFCKRSMAGKFPKLYEMSLMLILSKLPAKSVLRFRIACKEWNSITRGSDFADLQLGNGPHKDSNVIMILDYQASQPRFALSRLDGSRRSLYFLLGGIRDSDPVTNISNSYNGLVCVFTCEDTLLVNPCTAEFIVLPKVCFSVRASLSLGGLGFDVSTGKYKVVRIVTNAQRMSKECMIFTMGSRSWRKIDDTPFIPLKANTVFVDGSFFWAGHTEFVFALDIRREVFREIPFPKGSCQVSIGELAGHLYLADKEWCTPEMKLYVLQTFSEGPSWNLIYTIDLRTMPGGTFSYKALPLALLDGKIVLENNYIGLDYFDIESKRFTEPYVLKVNHPWHPVVNVESLISPRAIQQSTSNEDDDADADHPYVLLGGTMVSSDKEGMELDKEEEYDEDSSSDEEGSESTKVEWITMRGVGRDHQSYAGYKDGSLYDAVANRCIGTWSKRPKEITYFINGHCVPQWKFLDGPEAWLSSPRVSCSQHLHSREQRDDMQLDE